MKNKEQRINPLIEIVEKKGEELIEFVGYFGSDVGSIKKLYTDLSARVCYEVSEKDILHTECLDDKDLKMRIYVSQDTEVQLTKRFKAGDPPSFPFFGSNTKLPVSTISLRSITPLFPSSRCMARCEQQICDDGSNFKTTAGPGGSIIYVLTDEARNKLFQCLSKCGYSGILLVFAFNNAVARCEGSVTLREDPPTPEIPKWP
jgi:hypothetical protein